MLANISAQIRLLELTLPESEYLVGERVCAQCYVVHFKVTRTPIMLAILTCLQPWQ